MSRIRSVHPGLFTDEAFVTLSPAAQVFWIGLWCEADDQGVFEWKPLTLKMRLLPASPQMVEPLLEELVTAACIRRYEVDGRCFGVVRNFAKHQRPKSPKDVHHLPEELRNYAGFNGDGTRPDATTGRKRFGSGSEEIRKQFGTRSESGSQMEDGGGRMKDEGGLEPPSETPEADNRPAASRTARAAKVYVFESGVIRLIERDFNRWQAAWPHISLRGELEALAGAAQREHDNGGSWFHMCAGALAKRDREAKLAVEGIKAGAVAKAQAEAAGAKRKGYLMC